ncbi:MAG: hypothetical protein RMJ35_10400, partial [Phycisphaerales bacterium]|nr:hypothetical protein [Phycisphaerales bacterium]
MPTITRILRQRGAGSSHRVYLDGRFAFVCKDTTIARFHLLEGMDLSPEQIRTIEQARARQECFDSAMKFLQRRLHS